MALYLKVAVVEPEEMLSLGNSKHVPAAMNAHTTIEELVKLALSLCDP
jgi:hypothetical protein